MFRSLVGGATWGGANTGINDPLVNVIGFDPSTIYAGTTNRGVFRSIDGGDRWSRRASGLTADNIFDIAAVPSDPNRVYATSLGDVLGAPDAGDYRSLDRGDSWTKASAGLNPEMAAPVVVDPVGSWVFTGTFGGGVYRTR